MRYMYTYSYSKPKSSDSMLCQLHFYTYLVAQIMRALMSERDSNSCSFDPLIVRRQLRCAGSSPLILLARIRHDRLVDLVDQKDNGRRRYIIRRLQKASNAPNFARVALLRIARRKLVSANTTQSCAVCIWHSKFVAKTKNI